ncbi:MAG: T9SS type A sorting domain-containing protein [Ignavibacteriota bacterium]
MYPSRTKALLSWRKVYLLPLLLLSCFGSLRAATIHYIDFGGPILGYTYNPKSLNIEVGDTMVWRGDFTALPLTAITVPPGAKPIATVSSGTSYMYPVEVAGTYTYQNPVYGTIGMKGSFTASYLPHGSLTNEGTDFYLGLITPSYNYIGSNGYQAFAIITTYYDNTIRISYFDAAGNEVNGITKSIERRHSLQVELDLIAMRPDTGVDAAQFKTCHITSKYPVSIQFQSKGSNSGGSYLALPSLAVGKNYVVASYFDNPGNNALISWPGLPTKGENSGGAILIIGTQDATNVSVIPTTSTSGGHTGISGPGSNGLPHPFSFVLNKGQSYLIRSPGRDAGADLSGSLIQASKPISVLSGHEDANIGDFIGVWPTLSEGRDYMIEQLMPVEYWDTTGYLSLPFREATPPADDAHGDLYRVYTYDDATAAGHADVQGIPGGYPMQTSRYHYAEHSDITDAVDIFSTNGRKISVVQYDERSQPAKGLTPAPSMMNVIPKSRWRNTYNFSQLQAKTIDGITQDQYLNIIADSLSDIRVSNDGGALVPLTTAFNQVGSFINVSSHYKVTGAQYRVGAGSYFLHSTSPFVVYTYGMNQITFQTYYTFNFENSAPAGTQLNTGAVPAFKITVDTLSKCSGWTVCVRDTGTADPGIKAVMLVDDTDGIYFNRIGMKYSNVSFDSISPGYVNGELHPDVHSTGSFCFKVKFNNPLAAAFAPVAIIDNSGNGMIIRLNRSAPTISLATSPVPSATPDKISFAQQKIGNEICTTFVVKNTAPDGGAPLLLTAATMKKNDAAFSIRSVTPALPYSLQAQQSVQIQVCYNAKDSMRHLDTLSVVTDCFSIPISLDAHGSIGLISAADVNFGVITAGDTLCRNVLIKNVGTSPFTLKRSFILADNNNFTVDSSTLPLLLNPGSSTLINICFHPAVEGTFASGIDWSTDLPTEFSHSVKNHTNLSGTAKPKITGGVATTSETSFTLYPNPANGASVIVSLATAERENTTLQVFDVLGREVYHQRVSPDIFRIEIPIRDLSEGMYYVKLSSASGSMTERFVKGK